MDYNVVVLAGKLAAPPELREFESGTRLMRSLIAVRTDAPRRRVDVVPVTLWDPAKDHALWGAASGANVWTVGSVQRRFWSSAVGRQSRLEIVANHMEIGGDDGMGGTAWQLAFAPDQANPASSSVPGCEESR